MLDSTSVDLTKPHDTCQKCGRPTPLGVSLCERDNPARIKSPSTTQVHATVLIGVLVGFGLLLVLFRLGSAGASAFASSVAGWAEQPDGSIEVVVSVTNNGSLTPDATSLGKLVLRKRSINGTDIPVHIDEIRIGTTWADVASDTVPVSLAAFEAE